jgi:NADH-quinone oxidoreductase subunit C
VIHEEIVARVGAKFPDLQKNSAVSHDELEIHLSRESLVEVCLYLKEDTELAFDYLQSITAVDWLTQDRKPRFDGIYHMCSVTKGHSLVLRVPIPEDDCTCPSLCDIWEAANWHEREAYDFFGIKYTKHPDLRRILLADDWIGYPMRKDFPLGGEESFLTKQSSEPFAGEPEGLVPRRESWPCFPDRGREVTQKGESHE